MPPPIIQLRLERRLTVRFKTTPTDQKKRGSQRRGTHVVGTLMLTEKVGFKLAPNDLARLNALALKLRIAKSVLIRDAVMMWISMAETELGEQEGSWVETKIRSTPLAKRR